MEDTQMIIKYYDKEKKFNYINNYKDFLEKCCKTFEIDENEFKSLLIYKLDEDDKLIIENENDFKECLDVNDDNQIKYILESTIKKEIKNKEINENINKDNVKEESNPQINKEIIENINLSNLITAESKIKNIPLNTNYTNINNNNDPNNNNNKENNISYTNVELDFLKIKETIQLENKAFKDEIMNEVKKLNSEMEQEMKKNFKKNIHDIKEFLVGIDDKIKQNNNDLQSFKKNIVESISSIQQVNNNNNSNDNQLNQNVLLENLKNEINNQMLKSNIYTNNLISSLNEKIENLSKQIENKDNIIEKIEKLSKQIEDKNNINSLPKKKFENNIIEKIDLQIESKKNKNFEKEQNEIPNEEINSLKDKNFVQKQFYGCRIENENLTLTKNYEEIIKMKAYKFELILLNTGNIPWPINSMIEGNSDNNILQVKTIINKKKEIEPNERLNIPIFINFKNVKNEDAEINLQLNLFIKDKSINIIQNTFLFTLKVGTSNILNKKMKCDFVLTEDLFQEIKNKLNEDYEYSKQQPDDNKLRKKLIKTIIENNLQNLFNENKEKAIEKLVESIGEELLGV